VAGLVPSQKSTDRRAARVVAKKAARQNNRTICISFFLQELVQLFMKQHTATATARAIRKMNN